MTRLEKTSTQHNPVALITGASRGLGKAMALVFARHGYDLILISKTASALKTTADEIAQSFSSIHVEHRAFDLSVKSDITACAKWVIEFKKPLNILVNNAGYFLPGNISDEPEGSLEAMMNTNLYSAYHLTRALLPQMINSGSGHIFNICSIASLQAYPNGGAYSISKFALAGFSKNLRMEMQTKNIKVTGVYPGAAYTDSWKGSGIDEKRIMHANDVADMVYAASQLSLSACVEDIVLRPQLGDL